MVLNELIIHICRVPHWQRFVLLHLASEHQSTSHTHTPSDALLQTVTLIPYAMCLNIDRQTDTHRLKLENVAIVNALQLKVARRHASSFLLQLRRPRQV